MIAGKLKRGDEVRVIAFWSGFRCSRTIAAVGWAAMLLLNCCGEWGGRAKFATVSGKCHNPANPESLYRKCGFTGSDVWHILRKRA